MTDTSTIALRLDQILADARCESCGATLAECKASRGSDPAAPPWFGCCARGLMLDIPCHHVPDPGAMQRLADETREGTVAPPTKRGALRVPPTYLLLNQGEVWYPRPPADPIAISDMDNAWRYNAAKMLERNAAGLGAAYGLGFALTGSGPIGPSGDAACDAFESACYELDREIELDPVTWLKSTRLYRALIASLPTNPYKLWRLSQRARHWQHCEARRHNAAPCTCRTDHHRETP